MKLAPDHKIILAGSSITEDSPWPTWATWTTKMFGWTNVDNVSVRGLGNEVIILKAIQAAKMATEPVFITIQLTSVDKWDWYVQDPTVVRELSSEKHAICHLDKHDKSGFWSTGSHFPLRKEYYRENYFSLDWSASRTLQLITWFQIVCKQHGWGNYILFDSPIFSVTESQLNQGILEKQQCYDTVLIDNTLCEISTTGLDNNLYYPGLVGYCCLNDLPWYTPRFKGHPGSLSHLKFVRDIVSQNLSLYFKQIVSVDELMPEAVKMQQLVMQ